MKPEDIENREFMTSLRGYARDEVDAFKMDAARAIRLLQTRLGEATSTLAAARAEAASESAEIESLKRELAEARSAPQPERQAAPLEQEAAGSQPTDPRSDAFRHVALETEKILMAAEEVAEEMHEKAMREAAGIVTDARLRAEKIFAEVENAKRSAQQELERIRESRSMIASQMEDIGRRLAETVARLRVPVESPQRQSARARLQGEAPRQGSERPPAERQAIERQAAERYAQERQEVERQALERQLEERQAAERQAMQRRAAERKAAEAEAAREAAAREAAAKEAAVREAAAAQESVAEEAAASQEAAGRGAAPSTEAGEVPAGDPPADRSTKAAAAEGAALKELDGEPAPAAVGPESKIPAGARPKGPPKPARSQSPKPAAAQPAQAGSDPESSSLSQLLEEIRRTREAKPKEPASAEAPAAATSTPAPAPAAVAVLSTPEPQTPDPMLERRATALGDLPAQASRRLKRLLQEDHNDLLDRLRTRRGKGTLEDNLAPLPEQFARFQAGLTDALSKAFAEGRVAAGGSGSSDSGKAVSNLVARQVVNPLRAEVSRAVQGGLEAEDTPTAIAERASDVFRVWKGVRTELLGEGMVYAAFNQGLIDGWSRNPRVNKAWVASEEEECPNEVCAKNVAAGPVALKATFPSGHLTPPAHGGCTCTLKSV